MSTDSLITLTTKGAKVARDIHMHLDDLEATIARRTTAAEVQGFLKVIEAVEEEARRRTRRAP